MVFMTGCLARDNNDNNDANALCIAVPAEARKGCTEEIEGMRCVPRAGRVTLAPKAKKEAENEGKSRVG